MMLMQRASSPLPAPAPDTGAARSRTPGARCRLGRHTADNSVARNDNSSRPGGLLTLTTGTPATASAKQNVVNHHRLKAVASAYGLKPNSVSPGANFAK